MSFILFHNFIFFTPVIYYYNPSNAGDLPSNLNLTLSSFLNGISSSNWFSTLAKYYNTGYITGATSTNTLGPSYVSGVKLLYTDFFDCRYGWPGRTVPNVGNTVCQTLVTANDLQNVIMEVTNDVTRYPNSPRPNGDVVELVILGSSIQESFNPLSGLILGNGYCGYHGTFSNTDSRYSASAVGIWYKFAVVGASSSSTQNCIVVPASTSNGVLTDNIIFLVAHESKLKKMVWAMKMHAKFLNHLNLLHQ